MAIDINVTVKADENLEKILKSVIKLLKVEEREKDSKEKEVKKSENKEIEKEDKVEITLKEVQKLAVKKSTEGKRDGIKGILNDLKVDKISDLEKEKYVEFYERAEKL